MVRAAPCKPTTPSTEVEMAAGEAGGQWPGVSLRKARLMSFQMSSMDLIEADEAVGMGESGEKGRGDDKE